MGRDEAFVANGLWPCQNIGDMHLYAHKARCGKAGQAVGQGKAGVSKGPGIY